jgi:hypothetical protein
MGAYLPVKWPDELPQALIVVVPLAVEMAADDYGGDWAGARVY